MPTVTVAPSGGDYTTPWAAITAITDASSSNVYTVNVAAGNYQLPSDTYMTMKAYVNIIGANQATVIILGDELTDIVVVMSSNCRLSTLTITPFGDTLDGISALGKSGWTIDNVTVSAGRYGIECDHLAKYGQSAATPGAYGGCVLRDCTLNALVPLYLEDLSYSDIYNITATKTGATASTGITIGTASWGLRINNCTITLTDSGTTGAAQAVNMGREGMNCVAGCNITLTTARPTLYVFKQESQSARVPRGANKMIGNTITVSTTHASPTEVSALYIDSALANSADVELRGNNVTITCDNAPTNAYRISESAAGATPKLSIKADQASLGKWTGATPTEKRKNALVVATWKRPRQLSRTSLRGTRRN